jgi:FkbM family methyltransferase
MHDWPALRTSGWLEEYLGGRRAADYWRRVFDQVHAGQIDSWAYRWTYSCWRRGGLTALPTQNLVSNIGFGAGATHTVAAHNPFAAMPSYALPFPVRHPPRVTADSRADAYTQATLYNPGLARRALWRISRTLRPKEPMFVQLRHAIVKTLKALRHRLPGTFKQTSYSQEGEDLILRRVFEPQRGGFYVDVGAHHPQRFSNTCLFYALRWSGINIDATPGSMRLFKRLRPRDINLELAVGEAGPPKNFFVFNERAINTFDPEHAQRCVARGYKIVAQIPIPTRALGDILHQHMPPGRRIDFLSVDVEGLDLEVLRSNDWVRFKPTYILVELREDIETIASHPVAVFLHGHGYRIFAKTANTTFFCHRQQLAGEGK